jgi:hypothetical protein
MDGMSDTVAFPSNAAVDGVMAASLRPHFRIDWVGSGAYFKARSTREWWIGSKAEGAGRTLARAGGRPVVFFTDWPGRVGWPTERMLDDLSHPFLFNP